MKTREECFQDGVEAAAAALRDRTPRWLPVDPQRASWLRGWGEMALRQAEAIVGGRKRELPRLGVVLKLGLMDRLRVLVTGELETWISAEVETVGEVRDVRELDYGYRVDRLLWKLRGRVAGLMARRRVARANSGDGASGAPGALAGEVRAGSSAELDAAGTGPVAHDPPAPEPISLAGAAQAGAGAIE